MSRNTSKVIPISREEIPKKEQISEIPVQKGIVTAISPEAVEVLLSGETIKAVKSFSCLIDPEPGDTILCCRDEDGEVYVLGILAREQSQKAKVSFPADTTIESATGNLNLFSNQAVTIGAQSINSFSKKEVHKSDQAYLAFNEVVAHGRKLQATFQTVRVISNLINTMARQVIEKFKGYIRHTEDHDQIQAGQLTRRTDGLYSMDSRNTVMISKKETKIDGEKIYMA